MGKSVRLTSFTNMKGSHVPILHQAARYDIHAVLSPSDDELNVWTLES